MRVRNMQGMSAADAATDPALQASGNSNGTSWFQDWFTAAGNASAAMEAPTGAAAASAGLDVTGAAVPVDATGAPDQSQSVTISPAHAQQAVNVARSALNSLTSTLNPFSYIPWYVWVAGATFVAYKLHKEFGGRK